MWYSSFVNARCAFQVFLIPTSVPVVPHQSHLHTTLFAGGAYVLQQKNSAASRHRVPRLEMERVREVTHSLTRAWGSRQAVASDGGYPSPSTLPPPCRPQCGR